MSPLDRKRKALSDDPPNASLDPNANYLQAPPNKRVKAEPRAKPRVKTEPIVRKTTARKAPGKKGDEVSFTSIAVDAQNAAPDKTSASEHPFVQHETPHALSNDESKVDSTSALIAQDNSAPLMRSERSTYGDKFVAPEEAHALPESEHTVGSAPAFVALASAVPEPIDEDISEKAISTAFEAKTLDEDISEKEVPTAFAQTSVPKPLDENISEMEILNKFAQTSVPDPLDEHISEAAISTAFEAAPVASDSKFSVDTALNARDEEPTPEHISTTTEKVQSLSDIKPEAAAVDGSGRKRKVETCEEPRAKRSKPNIDAAVSESSDARIESTSATTSQQPAFTLAGLEDVNPERKLRDARIAATLERSTLAKTRKDSNKETTSIVETNPQEVTAVTPATAGRKEEVTAGKVTKVHALFDIDSAAAQGSRLKTESTGSIASQQLVSPLGPTTNRSLKRDGDGLDGRPRKRRQPENSDTDANNKRKLNGVLNLLNPGRTDSGERAKRKPSDRVISEHHETEAKAEARKAKAKEALDAKKELKGKNELNAKAEEMQAKAEEDVTIEVNERKAEEKKDRAVPKKETMQERANRVAKEKTIQIKKEMKEKTEMKLSELNFVTKDEKAVPFLLSDATYENSLDLPPDTPEKVGDYALEICTKQYRDRCRPKSLILRPKPSNGAIRIGTPHIITNVDLYIHENKIRAEEWKMGRMYYYSSETVYIDYEGRGLLTVAEYLDVEGVPETKPVSFEGRTPRWAADWCKNNPHDDCYGYPVYKPRKVLAELNRDRDVLVSQALEKLREGERKETETGTAAADAVVANVATAAAAAASAGASSDATGAAAASSSSSGQSDAGSNIDVSLETNITSPSVVTEAHVEVAASSEETHDQNSLATRGEDVTGREWPPEDELDYDDSDLSETQYPFADWQRPLPHNDSHMGQ
jgi:hypothetical protein